MASAAAIQRMAKTVKTAPSSGRPLFEGTSLQVPERTIGSSWGISAFMCAVVEAMEDVETAPRRRRRQPRPPERPPWAVDAGTDEFGDWAEFDYDGVRQRLRWIPPGTFMMGSPEDEVGRFDTEGPQHEVTIGAGFWLFATPVTQALYER